MFLSVENLKVELRGVFMAAETKDGWGWGVVK